MGVLSRWARGKGVRGWRWDRIVSQQRTHAHVLDGPRGFSGETPPSCQDRDFGSVFRGLAPNVSWRYGLRGRERVLAARYPCPAVWSWTGPRCRPSSALTMLPELESSSLWAPPELGIRQGWSVSEKRLIPRAVLMGSAFLRAASFGCCVSGCKLVVAWCQHMWAY